MSAPVEFTLRIRKSGEAVVEMKPDSSCPPDDHADPTVRVLRDIGALARRARTLPPTTRAACRLLATFRLHPFATAADAVANLPPAALTRLSTVSVMLQRIAEGDVASANDTLRADDDALQDEVLRIIELHAPHLREADQATQDHVVSRVTETLCELVGRTPTHSAVLNALLGSSRRGPIGRSNVRPGKYEALNALYKSLNIDAASADAMKMRRRRERQRQRLSGDT